MLVPTLARLMNSTHSSATAIPVRFQFERMRLLPIEAQASPAIANPTVSATTLKSAARFTRARRSASPSTIRAGTIWSSPCWVPSGASAP
jgi:hypothetical protein